MDFFNVALIYFNFDLISKESLFCLTLHFDLKVFRLISSGCLNFSRTLINYSRSLYKLSFVVFDHGDVHTTISVTFGLLIENLDVSAYEF